MDLGPPIRASDPVGRVLGQTNVEFLHWALGAFERILPHLELDRWEEAEWRPTESVWASPDRTEIRISIALGSKDREPGLALETKLRRRNVSVSAAKRRRILDTREHAIAARIATNISLVLAEGTGVRPRRSIHSLRLLFDEQIVAEHLEGHHKLDLNLMDVLAAVHMLAEQSYEDRALTLGVVLDPARRGGQENPVFPRKFFESKKYKALSDGIRTAYHVSTDGHVLNFVDLRNCSGKALTSRHHFPVWTEEIARSSRSGRCGICLTREGDILVFDEGSLRFTYRYGRWRYWNHSHLLRLMKDRTKTQTVQPTTLGKVVATVYRAALDASFSRTGGLFVILHARHQLRHIVRAGDEIAAARRTGADREFDRILAGHTVQTLPRTVLAELAALDGAIVVDKSGRLLAFGAILQPRRRGRLYKTEGSRTKAAVGASHYGLSVKVSSDGDITVYYQGVEFLRV